MKGPSRWGWGLRVGLALVLSVGFSVEKADAQPCDSSTLSLYLEAYGVLTDGSTWIHHKLTRAEGPGVSITQAATAQCNSVSSMGTGCQGAFKIMDVSKITKVQVYFRAGAAKSYTLQANTNVEFEFQAVAEQATCLNNFSNPNSATVAGSNLRSGETCSALSHLPPSLPTSGYTFDMGCDVFVRVKFGSSISSDLEVPEVVLMADIPAMDSFFTGTELTYTWKDTGYNWVLSECASGSSCGNAAYSASSANHGCSGDPCTLLTSTAATTTATSGSGSQGSDTTTAQVAASTTASPSPAQTLGPSVPLTVILVVGLAILGSRT